MFKKLLLALTLCLVGLPALGQNPQCPTRPPGDSSNACASTAFVGTAIGSISVSWTNITGTPTTLAGYGITNARVQLTGNQSYYVNGNSGSTATCGPAGASTCVAGTDSNDCLTPSTACLTLSHAYMIATGRDFVQQWTASIYLAHNTGTTNYNLVCANGPLIGAAVVFVIGDSGAPTATVVQDPALGYGLQINDLCTIEYDYIKFIDSTSNNASGHILMGGTGNAGHLDTKGIDLGALTIGVQVTVGSLASFAAVGNFTIDGGALQGFNVSGGGAQINFASATVTLSGTPAYSTAFMVIGDGGSVIASPSTFSGSATGPRCVISGPPPVGGIQGNNPNKIFPGNSDCVIDQYVGAIGVQTGSGGSSSFNFGSSGQPLLSGGGSGSPNSYGTLGITGGGTGSVSFTAHSIIAGEGTSSFVSIGPCTTNQVAAWTSGIGSDPTCVNIPTLLSIPIVCDIVLTSATTCNNGGSSANNGTYTVPANAKYLIVEGCGGAGGGAGSGTIPGAPGAGVTTTFGTSLLTGNGGAAGLSNGAAAAGGTATGGDTNISGGSGGSAGGVANVSGGAGGISLFGGAGPSPAPGAVGVAASANSCSGGSGASSGSTILSGGGGGAGGYFRKLISSPNATYSYAIGTGGNGGTAGTGGFAGGNGAAGHLIITVYFQ